MVNTDEYAIYARVSTWGFAHVAGMHGDREVARDDDGIDEIRVNTTLGVWSPLRLWWRSHRGL